jgi:DNA-binding response OmpR family regulator
VGSGLALIIEDDADLAIIFSEALKAVQYETEIIRDGNAALARLAVTTPNLVVLDLHLPYVAGTDILRQIRSDDRLTGTFVIVATVDARMAEALHEEADLVLVKPVSFGQLRDLAARLSST